MKNWTFAFLVVLGALFVSCGSSVEGEQAAWEANKQRLTKLKANYPNFGAAIDEVLSAAESQMKTAEGISGDEEKITAMAKANSLASPKFVNQLSNFESLVSSTESSITKVTQNAKEFADQNAARTAANNARNAIREAKLNIKNGRPANATAAEGITENATSKVKRAKDDISEVLKAIQKKEDAANKAKEDENKAKQDEANANAVKTFKCANCGNKYDGKTAPAECKGCGGKEFKEARSR